MVLRGCSTRPQQPWPKSSNGSRRVRRGKVGSGAGLTPAAGSIDDLLDP